jgi:hypothetical protein
VGIPSPLGDWEDVNRGDISRIETAVRERQVFLESLEILHQTTNVLVLEACCKNTDWLSDWALDLGMATPSLEVYVEWTAEEVVGTYGVRNQEFVHRTEAASTWRRENSTLTPMRPLQQIARGQRQ